MHFFRKLLTMGKNKETKSTIAGLQQKGVNKIDEQKALSTKGGRSKGKSKYFSICESGKINF